MRLRRFFWRSAYMVRFALRATAVLYMRFCEIVHMLWWVWLQFAMYLHWNCTLQSHRIGKEPIHVWHRTHICIACRANPTVWTVSLTTTQSNFCILKIAVANCTVWTSPDAMHTNKWRHSLRLIHTVSENFFLAQVMGSMAKMDMDLTSAILLLFQSRWWIIFDAYTDASCESTFSGFCIHSLRPCYCDAMVAMDAVVVAPCERALTTLCSAPLNKAPNINKSIPNFYIHFITKIFTNMKSLLHYK